MLIYFLNKESTKWAGGASGGTPLFHIIESEERTAIVRKERPHKKTYLGRDLDTAVATAMSKRVECKLKHLAPYFTPGHR
jgi:hypothetical protein